MKLERTSFKKIGAPIRAGAAPDESACVVVDARRRCRFVSLRSREPALQWTAFRLESAVRSLVYVATISLVFVAAACRTVDEPVLAPAWTASDAAQPLTHDDCVRLAVESAPNAASWSARLMAARAGLAGARAIPNPTLGLGWEDLALNRAAAGPVQKTFTLGYALADLFSHGRRVAVAEHELAAEDAQLMAEKAKLAAEVCAAYDELLAARRVVAFERTREAAAQKAFETARKFVSSGLRSRAASAKADVDVRAATFVREKAEAAARASELSFAFALGFERPVALTLADKATVAEPPAELETLLTRAAESRPEIIAAKEKVAAALERARIEVERISILPSFEAGPRFQGDAHSAVASLQVELPVFKSNDAAEVAANAELLSAVAELRRVAHEVAAETATARERLDAALRVNLAGARDVAARRRKLVDDVRRLFGAGEAELDQTIEAEKDALDAEKDVLEAEAEASAAAIRLRRAIGG